MNEHPPITEHAPLPPETLAGLGDCAISPPKRESHRSGELTMHLNTVLTLASYGGTTEEVAEHMKCEVRAIEVARDQIITYFGAPNMAAAVNQAILHKVLPVTRNEDIQKPDLDRRELQVLRGIARGEQDFGIYRSLGLTRAAYRRLKLGMFDKLKQPGDPNTGRTHCVRKAYETGVFEIPE